MTDIRPARAADIAAVRRVVRDAYAPPYLPQIGGEPALMSADYESLVAAGAVWVAVVDDRVVGVLVLRADADSLLLENVAVEPAVQRRGIDHALIAFAEDRARELDLSEVRLYVNARMSENLALYPRLGYAEVDRRHEDGFDRISFRKGIRGDGEAIAPTGFDGLIVDLDGVVWLGGQPIAGAVEAVAKLRARGVRLLFLTNDPSSSRAEQAARLDAIGIPATADDVMTSAAATAHFLAGRADLRGHRVFAIGSHAFKQDLVDVGFELVDADDAHAADLVVLGGHSGFRFTELRAATRAVFAGAQLFAAARDPFVPTSDGPEPATGAIVAAVETASGVTATVVGKPEPYMFKIAREALLECRRVAVIGDNLASDIAGAKRTGLDAILVLTGGATAADIDAAEHPPDFVLASLAELPRRLGK
jgi:glycerol 3-phosphatase-2